MANRLLFSQASPTKQPLSEQHSTILILQKRNKVTNENGLDSADDNMLCFFPF
jgi:hypothetical protein